MLIKSQIFLSRSLASGISLIEVLVATVILSIGLLGVAGLELTSLRFMHGANLMYQAGLQASDMADRIRANPIGIDSGSYNNIAGIGSDPGCINTGCTPAQIAATDAFEWNKANAVLLPQGVGTVQGQSGRFTMTISWREMTPIGPSARYFVMVVQP